MRKQVLCILLTLSVILGTATVPVLADSIDFNYIYSVSDGKAEITGIIGEPDIDLELPSHLDGYPVTSIADAAFVGCSSIRSVTLPATVTNIGDGAFAERTNHIIVNVSTDNPCYSSQNGALFNKDKTVLICYPNVNSGIYTIPDSVTEIGAFAFSDCAMLQSVIIPSGVTVIGRSAFYDCTSLTSVTIPNSVICIEDAAFSCCYSLKSVSVGNGVTDIEIGAFYGCTALTAINVSKYNPVYSSQGGVLFNKSKTSVLLFPRKKSGTYTIPSGVKNIDYGAFQRCEGLTAVTIPDSVEHIGDYAFAHCNQLSSVQIGNGVSTIGNHAFFGCGFAEIAIPDNVTDIGDYAFAFCEQLYSAAIGKSVKNIGRRSFYCCGLTEIAIPDSVEYIGEYAFADCEWLNSVTIGRGITKIGRYAFGGTRLNQVYISDLSAWCNINFASADANPLYYASNLYIDGELAASLVIPDSVIKIGKYAFYNCGSVISVTLGSGVKEIGQDAFYQCRNLLSINVSEENPYYSSENGILFNKDKTTLIYYGQKNYSLYNIPDGVTEIGAYAFSESSNLKAVSIPDSVTSIGDFAFYNCEMNVVEVGIGISSLESNIFTGCSLITDIYYRGSADEWNAIEFPSGLGNLYLADVHFNSNGIKKYYSNDLDYYDLLERLSEASDRAEFIGIVENNSEMLGFNGDYSTAAAGLLYDMYRYDMIDDYMSNESKVKVCVLIAALNSGAPISAAKYIKRIYRDNERLSFFLNDIIRSEETDKHFTQAMCNTYGFIQSESELPDVAVKALLLTIINHGAQEDFERYLTSFGGVLGINYYKYIELREDSKKKAFYDLQKYHILSMSQFKAVFQEVCSRYASNPTSSGGGGGCASSGSGGGGDDYTLKIYGDYTYRLSGGEAIITGVNRSVCGSVKLPSFIEGCPVTCIESGAFEYFDCITAVEIPLSVTIIEDNAFRRCDRLTDVYYCGDEEDWSGVYTDCGNENLTNAEFHYTSGGQASLEIEPTLKVSPTNAKIGDNVILAAFRNGLLYDIEFKEYSGTPIEFAVPEEYDDLKIMLWDSMTGMKPLAPASTK